VAVEATAGVRELKDNLSRYLRIVREGGSVLITDRGKPLACLQPAGQGEPEADRLRRLAETGEVQWGGGRMERCRPSTVLPAGAKTAARTLIEDRE